MGISATYARRRAAGIGIRIHILSTALLVRSPEGRRVHRMCVIPRGATLMALLDNSQLQGIEIVFAGKNNPIYRFNSRGAKEYPQALTMELSIPPHQRYTYLQQDINNNCGMEVMMATEILVVKQ